MLQFNKSSLSHLLLLTIAAGVFLSSPISLNTPTAVEASTLTFTITQANFPNLSTSTATTAEVLGSITVSGVQIDLGIKNATRTTTGSTSLDLAQNASALYNITPLPGTIKSIVITQKTGQSNTLHVGNSSRIINGTAGSYTVITDSSLGSATVSSTSQTFNSASFPILATRSDISYFAFLPSGGTQTQIQSISFEMTVAAIVATSGETYSFAVDFLAQTENKAGDGLIGFCTDEDMKWSFASVTPNETSSTNPSLTLEGQFFKLTEGQKDAFKTDTTDPQIHLARQRYLYLRTVNPALFDFVYQVTPRTSVPA